MGLKQRLSGATKVIVNALKLFPVEIGISIYTFCFGALLIEEVDITHDDNIFLVPLFLGFAYLMNCLFPRSGNKEMGEGVEGEGEMLQHNGDKIEEEGRGANLRMIYYLSWLPIIPFWFVDVSDWINSVSFGVSLVATLPLVVFAARRVKDNVLFAADAMKYVLNLIAAVVFTSIAYGLVMGIYFSAVFIFGFEESMKFIGHSALFLYSVVAPILYFSFIAYNIGKETKPNRFLDILLNFIVTPALLIYSVVLLVYFLKILFTWSLPIGGVAMMVLIYAAIAFVTKALQPLLSKRYYDWFFDRLSIIISPAIFMYWVAILYRVSQYGLTESRVYVLICGVVATVLLILFFRKGRGRYIVPTYLAVALLALFTYIPPITAGALSNQSQYKRALKIANSLDLLEDDLTLKVEIEIPEGMSKEEFDKEFVELSDILYAVDSKSLEKLGLENAWEFSDRYSAEGERYRYRGVESDYIYIYYEAFNYFDLSGFSELHVPSSYVSDSYKYYYTSSYSVDSIDVLRLYKKRSDAIIGGYDDEDLDTYFDLIFEITFDELLQKQLQKCGLTMEDLKDSYKIQAKSSELLRTEFDGNKLVFSGIHVEDIHNKPRISNLNVQYLFIK